MHQTDNRPESKDVSEWVERNFSVQLGELRDAVAENSFTENIAGVDAVQDLYARRLSELGLEVSLTPIAKRGSGLIAENKLASSRPPILLVGHADTVHSPDNGSADFKELIVDGDSARGPGAFDMKGGNAAIIQALRGLKDFGLLQMVPIRVLINSSEENTVPESREFVLKNSEGCCFALIFEFGRTDEHGTELLVTARKGGGNYDLVVTGEGGHAARIHTEGKSASVALARRVVALNDALQNEGLEQTINFSQFSGGSVSNVIPASGSAHFEIRNLRMEDHERALETAKKIIEDADIKDGCKTDLIRKKLTFPMEKRPETDAVFSEYQEAARAVGLNLQQAPVNPGQSDGNFIAPTVPVLDSLGPMGGGAHQDSEWVSLSSLKMRTAALMFLLASKASE